MSQNGRKRQKLAENAEKRSNTGENRSKTAKNPSKTAENRPKSAEKRPKNVKKVVWSYLLDGAVNWKGVVVHVDGKLQGVECSETLNSGLTNVYTG